MTNSIKICIECVFSSFVFPKKNRQWAMAHIRKLSFRISGMIFLRISKIYPNASCMLNAPMAAYQSRDWSFGMGPQIDRTLRQKTIENRKRFQSIFVENKEIFNYLFNNLQNLKDLMRIKWRETFTPKNLSFWQRYTKFTQFQKFIRLLVFISINCIEAKKKFD